VSFYGAEQISGVGQFNIKKNNEGITKMIKEGLKPCPFCGVNLDRRLDEFVDHPSVNNCELGHTIFTEKAWSVRPIEDVLNQRIMELEQDNNDLSYEVYRRDKRIAELEDLLHQIKNWCKAYPLEIAREPTQEETKLARKILKDADMSLSLFMISAMRRITTGITNEILGDLK